MPAAPRRRIRSSVIAALSATLVSSLPAHAEAPVRLRVLTWNVWGVPTVSTNLEARMRALPEAIASTDADLILLQELWQPAHGVSVARGLEQRGYRFSHHFASKLEGQTGLFLASRSALVPEAFHPFSVGRLPHTVWQLDWLVSKGVGSCLLETPLGQLRIEDTHLQAQYINDSYDAERLSQATELVLLNRSQRGLPLILGGDFNSGANELPRTALHDLAELDDATHSESPDTVYARSGRGISLRIVGARSLLDEPRLLDNGVRTPLSDHSAVLVELELSRCEPCSSAAAVLNQSAEQIALAALSHGSDITPGRVLRALLVATALLAAGAFWRRRVPRTGSLRARAVYQLGIAVVAIGLLWSSYLGVIYYPLRARALERVAHQLDAAFRH